MSPAMAEMICMEGLRQDMFLQAAVKAGQPLSWAPQKVSPAQAVSALLCHTQYQGHGWYEAGEKPSQPCKRKNGLQLCWRRNSSREPAGWVSLQAWEAFHVCVWRFLCTSLNIFKWSGFCCYKLNYRVSGSCFQLKRVILFLRFLISLPSALLIRVHVGNILIDQRLGVRIHVSAYHIPKFRVFGISGCADASCVPHHTVNLLWTNEDK